MELKSKFGFRSNKGPLDSARFPKHYIRDAESSADDKWPLALKYSGPALVFSGCSGDIIGIDQPVLLPAHTPTQQKEDKRAEPRWGGMNLSRECGSSAVCGAANYHRFMLLVVHLVTE